MFPLAFHEKRFKDLWTAEFVYGYLDIVNSETPEKQQLMTKHLLSLMRLASEYVWEAVLFFHAVVLDLIEAGLANWRDDFSEIEQFNFTESQRLYQKPLPSNINNAQVTPDPSNRPQNYCREWNCTGSCKNIVLMMQCITAIGAVIISIFKGWNLLTTTEKEIYLVKRKLLRKMNFSDSFSRNKVDLTFFCELSLMVRFFL